MSVEDKGIKKEKTFFFDFLIKVGPSLTHDRRRWMFSSSAGSIEKKKKTKKKTSATKTAVAFFIKQKNKIKKMKIK